MTTPYRICILVSRYVGVPPEQVGPKLHTHLVEAEHIDGAFRAAKLLLRGTRMNPNLSDAEIVSVSALMGGHTVVETEIPGSPNPPIAREAT